MRNNNKKKKILILIILLLSVTIGYALISTTLKIDGDTTIKKNTWSIYWDENSIKLKDGSKGNAPTVSLDSDDETTILNFSTTLDMPGDYYEFTVDAVNDGTIDAMIDGITPIEVPQSLQDYISCTVMYADRTTPANYHLLKAGIRVKYRIRVEFLDITREQFNNIPQDGLDCDFTYEVKYAQANNSAIPRPTFFGTATWDAIKAEYDAGDPEDILLYNMREEALKSINIDLDYDGVYEQPVNVRIANLSTPNECSGSNYSQTACGFVVEFAEIPTTHIMNYYDKNSYAHGVGEGTWGGWKYSDGRAYLNGYIYEHDDKDYSDISFIKTLPTDLSSKIIDTEVSSDSWRPNNPDAFMVTDKLYYLSPKEVWGTGAANADLNYDRLASTTRQLDYYSSIGTQADEDNYYKAIKPVLNPDDQEWEGVPPQWSKGFWALRASYSSNSYDSSFYRVMKNGEIGWTYSSNGHGVAPAFRIGKEN